MRRRDQTSMGGEAETFLTTHWSLIEDIQSGPGQDKDRALIGLLLDRYWKPVYCYLRQRGYDNEQAKDLTQSFFHEIVLYRDFVRPDGKRKRPHVFRIVLSFSRKGYSEAVYHQSTDNFIRCLENAFWHFGGALSQDPIEPCTLEVLKSKP